MALIGYARVSTDEQDTTAQLDKPRRAGCVTILDDRASGGSRSRPSLVRALAAIGQGDTLVVVRIDRLARSLSHLLEIVETLRAKGMLMTQMLGAFAEFERALIRERTRVGLNTALERGARPGNPKMHARDPGAIDDLRHTLKERHLNELIDGRSRWLPLVQRLRPALPWALVLRHVRAVRPPVRTFTERTLVKAC